MSVFGPVVTGNDVALAVRAWLQYWLPTYLAEAERDSGREPGTLPLPRSWTSAPAFYQFNDQQLPAAIVVSTGTDEITRRGDGSYGGVFGITAFVLAKGHDRENALELADRYAGSIARLAVDKGSLNGFAAGTEFLGFVPADAPPDYMPTGWAVGVALAVRIGAVVTATGGPALPDLDPDDRPDVATAEIAVERITL